MNNRQHPLHSTWLRMRERCRNPKHVSYLRYGGIGVTICKRWDSFENFAADMGPKPVGTSIDRYPNNKGNYELGNCRWATLIEQNNNRRNNKLITYQGKTQTVAQWA